MLDIRYALGFFKINNIESKIASVDVILAPFTATLSSINFKPFQQCCIWYRNQSFDLLCKTNNWFLCELQHWTEMGSASYLIGKKQIS